MKLYKLAAVAGLFVGLAVVATLFGTADAHAAVATAKATASHYSDLVFYGAQLVLATGIDSLRAQHRELITKAEAKRAEIKEGMTAEQVRAIETEHAALLADVRTVADRIAVEERAQPAPPAPPAPHGNEAVAAERARVTEIHRLCQRHATVLPDNFGADHIAQGTALDQVRTLVLDLVAKKQSETRINPRVQIVTDEGDTIRSAVGDAVLLRANPQAIQPNTEENRTRIDAARQFRGMSLMEIGRAFVQDGEGIRLRGLDKRELAAVLLGMKRAGGMMSTSDFPNILANVASKRLRDTYKTAVQTWRPFCRQNNAPDFKERAIVQLSGMPDFRKVREGQEYQRASLADSVEKYSIATYGRIIAITRQTLINDDLGAFDRLPTLFGRAAAEFESDTVWGIVISNPTMGDGVELFHADHGNLAAAGAAPSETTLNDADIAMGAQVDASGKPMNLRAKFLAVSRKHKVAAQKLLMSVQATKTGDVNVYANSMDLIVEDRLYKAGAGNKSPWLTIADPAQWDTIEYAYLEGEDGLYTEERIGFEVDGVEIKGRLDFGAKAIDYKGFQLNNGD